MVALGRRTRRPRDRSVIRYRPECRRLLDRLAAADLEVRIWETTSDVGVASFCCLVAERTGDFADPEYGMAAIPPARWHSCVPSPKRRRRAPPTSPAPATTYPSTPGSRPLAVAASTCWPVTSTLAAPPSVSFDSVPSFTAPSLAGDLDWLLARLRVVGIDQAIAVDLSKESLGLPVMRIVVPGLEGPNNEGAAHPGAWARRPTDVER